ncbi:hypothetical protein EB796_005033 [Bugula neritina]|uniref:Uncharacterized protein n=1 Tax=Bugula neritina TaxID=10212 RepID=A0A7J7KDA2_BUGNE|nr:hypothetical protein EB796_005033 [Bugula neritina]
MMWLGAQMIESGSKRRENGFDQPQQWGCVECSILFADHPFTIVLYKDWIILGIRLDGLKTEIVVHDKEFNIVKSWEVEVIPCDIAVVDNKVVLSRQLPGNLKSFHSKENLYQTSSGMDHQ